MATDNSTARGGNATTRLLWQVGIALGSIGHNPPPPLFPTLSNIQRVIQTISKAPSLSPSPTAKLYQGYKLII
jgi:hypothetical protein